MIDRRSLRFRLTLLYTCCGFIVFATLGLGIVLGVFEQLTRPLALDLARSARSVEDAVAAAPAAESQESMQRRIVARNRADGILLVALPAMQSGLTNEAPTHLPPGEISIGMLFGLAPNFVPVRGGTIVIFPESARIAAILQLLTIVIALTLTVALWIAWLVARLGTRETLKPLLTVTAELERFASGDFTPRPQAVSDQTEFGALAAAYNGAAHKVTQAFLERRRVEDQIRQFVAEAGHELRTPLTVVAGYIDVLRRGGFEDVEIRRAAFASLTSETKRMRTLVERLMTLARLDRVLAAEPEVVDVGTIARQAVDALAIIATTPISLEAPDDLLVLGEPVDVYEAIANLLENALKYGERTAIAVVVAANGDSIVVRVRDGGPGISEIDRSRIFERFYRGTDRGEVPGSGLGLAIAVKAAERLGGRIELQDARAGSTTFAVIVPALDGISSMLPRTPHRP